MSPVSDTVGASFKNTGGTGSRLLGVRESNQALAELKTKLEFALSRLNDQDTQRTGIEEIREFLQTLYPDWFPMVISCIGEAGTNLKPLGRCESVKLLGLLAELHGDSVVPLLMKILQVVVTRLQDADLHLREACAETVFRLARALVIDEESSAVFATLLKPLFGALGEHSKWVQIGAAACICSVIQGSPPAVVSDNLGRLCSRLVQHLSLPLAMAKPQLLGACIYAMEAVKGADFDEVLPSLMPCLESCLNASSDWQTRKQAIEVLQTIGDNPDLGSSLDLEPVTNQPGATPLQRRIALLLEVVRNDKVRAVREAVKDAMLRWTITKTPGPSSALRSSSPTMGPARSADKDSGDWQSEARQALQQRQGSASAARSGSPNPGAGEPIARTSDLKQQPMNFDFDGGGGGTPMGGNAGVRQKGSVRAATRERQEFEDVQVLVPDKPRASMQISDAAAEKARVIKEALSGAALTSTKKPRPKRERQSIFNTAVNKNFFNPAMNAAQAGPGAGGAEYSEDRDAGEYEDEDALGDSETQALQEEELAREMEMRAAQMKDEELAKEREMKAAQIKEEELSREREIKAAQVPAKRTSPRRDRPASIGRGTAASGSRGAMVWPETPETPPTAYGGEEGQEASINSAEEDEVIQRYNSKRVMSPRGDALVPPLLPQRVLSPRGTAGASRVLSPRGTAVAATGGAARVMSPRGTSGAASASGVRRMPSGTRRAAPKPAANSPRRLEISDADGGAGTADVAMQAPALAAAAARRAGADALARLSPPSDSPGVQPSLSNSLLEELAERLQALEDEKRAGEERLVKAIQILERDCKGQADALEAQSQQLEQTERRLQVQEQQSRHQEQRVQQQEQQMRQQEGRLHEQELQIQQLEQQFDEQNGLLREHEQQLDLQDQCIEEQKTAIDELILERQADAEASASASASTRPPSTRPEDQVSRSVSAAAILTAPVENLSRPALEAWANSAATSAPQPVVVVPSALPPHQVVSEVERPGEQQRPITAASLREGLMQASLDGGANLGGGAGKGAQAKKASGPLWEKVLELCEEQRYLEAYKQVIAEPEETCLLRLMQHTGPIVEQLDAESNSRLIRRLIHILSSPKEPASSCIEQVFGWLWQALEVGIHFTSSQVEDLAAALQKASAPHSFRERAEAAQLLSRVQALRRS